MPDVLRRGAAVLGLAAVVATACTSNAPRGSATHANAPHTNAAGTTGSAPHLDPVTSRCGPPALGGARTRFVAGPGRARLSVVEVGAGRTTALFLHQTDEEALCGWWPFAAWLVQHYHVHAVLADLCGYGASHCPDPTFAADQLAQVRSLVHDTARTARLVLVGASMGGALALASATRTGADAVVDLSGPPDWSGASAFAAAPKLTVPTLIADSRFDVVADYAELRSLFVQIPAATKKFVTGDGPHGWDLLTVTRTTRFTPLAHTVADWIVGRYSG